MRENLQFLIMLALFGYILFLQQCNPSTQQPNSWSRDTVIHLDTILPTPVIVEMPTTKIPAPTIIYIDSTQRKAAPMVVQQSSTNAKAVHQYQDSLSDENLTIYYDAVVEGQLLQNKLDYQLKIPKQITKTVTIQQPVPVPTDALLLTGGAGINSTGLSSVLVGMQFVSKRGFAVGYDYDLLQNSHQIKLGVRLFQPKSKLHKHAE